MNKYHKELLKIMKKNEKATEKALIRAYSHSLAEIKETIVEYMVRYEDLNYSEWLQLNRLLSLEQQINDVLNRLYNTNYNIVDKHAFKMYEDNYFGTFYELEQGYELNLSFSMLNEDYVRKAIEYPVGGLRLSERLYEKHLNDLKIKVKATLQDHAINNKGYRMLAKNLSEISVADYKQSLRIAVTEGGRLASLARDDSYKEAKELGIDLQKKWISTLDEKTRDLHVELDGQTIGIDEEFEIAGYTATQPRLFGAPEMDIWCRCDTITVVEGISPNLRKDNISKEEIEYENYDEWYEDRVGGLL